MKIRSERGSAILRSCVRSSRHVNPPTALSHLQDGPLAIGAVRGEELMVVLFTIRAALSLEEPGVAQVVATRRAHKVLGVPHLTQCCDYLHEQRKPLSILYNYFTFQLHGKLSARPTFPTMPLLQKAQWPFVAVRTPIFSRSELRPPSKSSMASFFLLTFVSETALLLLSVVSRSSSASA